MTNNGCGPNKSQIQHLRAEGMVDTQTIDTITKAEWRERKEENNPLTIWLTSYSVSCCRWQKKWVSQKQLSWGQSTKLLKELIRTHSNPQTKQQLSKPNTLPLHSAHWCWAKEWKLTKKNNYTNQMSGSKERKKTSYSNRRSVLTDFSTPSLYTKQVE